MSKPVSYRRWLVALVTLASLTFIVSLAAYGKATKPTTPPPAPKSLTETVKGFKAVGVHKSEPNLAALPKCREEDGTTQEVCVWDDGTGSIVINWNYGTRFVVIPRK